MEHATLEIFCAVAEELSVTRAAQRLGRVQSNVTTRVQQLEEELGVALFLRDNKRMALSPQGERFLHYAKALLALAEEARQVLHPAEPAGVLRIGSMESTAASRLPEPLASYHRQFPKVRLRLSDGPSRQLVAAVHDRILDGAFVALPPVAEGDAAIDLAALGLASATVFKEELVLLLPAGHAPVRRAEDVTIRSVAAFTTGCTYRAITERLLERGPAAPPLDVQEMGSYHGMLACVASGECVSLMPRSVIALMGKPKGMRELPIMKIDTLLVWRQGYETPAFEALRGLFAAPRR
ncbi:LysR family transcriptional regulator [Variovorax sp. LT1R16]|uniref:LysR family transcriptional regulator n=1 Tax=Variovorax sp. LT1R16 TaxID=3443728 RepID=UPI003F467644